MNVDTPTTSKVFVLTFAVEPLPVAVIVTAPPDIAETSKFVPKLIVPAVPTVEPSCLTTTPEPDAVIPVSAEPSSDGSAPVNCAEGIFVKPVAEPLNDVAVKIPVTTAPVLVVLNFSTSLKYNLDSAP